MSTATPRVRVRAVSKAYKSTHGNSTSYPSTKIPFFTISKSREASSHGSSLVPLLSKHHSKSFMCGLATLDTYIQTTWLSITKRMVDISMEICHRQNRALM